MKIFLVILAFLTCFQAKAGLILIDSDQETSLVGDIVTLTLTGQDFDPFNIFNFALTFDTALYEFSSNTLNSDLGARLRVKQSPDTADTEGLFFSFFDFNGFTPANVEFTLASFQLSAIGSGGNTFNIKAISFSNFFNGSIDARAGHPLPTFVTNNNGSIPVPEPTTFALFILASVGLIARRIKN